jgi:HK97 family phage portal protein
VWNPFSRKPVEERALSAIQGYWPDYSDGPTALGHVSVDRALALVPVFGAIRLIASSIASLPPVLYYQPPGGGIPERQPTPSLFRNPSIHGTLFDWFHRGTASMASSGDAIGLITQRDYYGYPTMAEWLNPAQVATQDGKLYGAGSFMNPLWWWYGRPIDPRELIHIPWFTMPYRVRGMSPIGAYQLTANAGIGAQEYAANWYGNGGVPPGTFRNSERTFKQADADQITNMLTARLQSRKPLVYGRDWEYNPIAIKPHEAQFIETMRLTATQIAVVYGLPPEKLGGTTGDSLTYATVELNNIDYLTHSLRPWLVRWEQALTKCFPNGYYVKFDTNEMLRLDAKTQAEIDQMSLGFNPPPWMEVDEVRARRDLPPSTKVNKVESLRAQPKPQPQPSTNGQQPMMRDRQNGSSPNGKISNTNHQLSGSKPAGVKGN